MFSFMNLLNIKCNSLSSVSCIFVQHVVLFLPMMLKVAYSNVMLGEALLENTLFHLLLASALRYLHIQLWMTTTRFHGLVKNHKIQKECHSFEQKDREAHWYEVLKSSCPPSMPTNFHSLNVHSATSDRKIPLIK